ncbi:hypothetical protein ACFWIA_20440 [Streptomyces sp. NPDC127068]|uniref:hypothetical protein n=1 Tax=Streptomyces sp. NPDC127068 TaxID=3347127 RepID=UPI003667962B
MTTRHKRGLLARLFAWWSARRERRRARAADDPSTGVDPGSTQLGTVDPLQIDSYAELAPGEDPVLLVARGDAFDFHVLPHFRWQSSEMSVERLRERAAALSAEARDEFLRRAWGLARDCDADDPVAAETLINTRLAAGWCYDDAEGLIKCRPTARVRVDPVLRDRVRPARLAEQGMKEDLRLGLLKAAHARQLTEEWLQVIATLEQGGELTQVQRTFLVPFAAVLADGDFATAVDKLRTARRLGTEALAEVLNQATTNHEQVGLFEFANAYDKALNSFSQQMGLTPFSWILDASHTTEGPE